jgi:hypothetical protein
MSVTHINKPKSILFVAERSTSPLRVAVFFAFLLPISLLAVPGARAEESVMQFDSPISQTGTISFVLHTDKTYFNGQGQDTYAQNLIRLPGVCELAFRRSDVVINLTWTWENQEQKHLHGIMTDLVELPGPETYYLQYTWDSARGLSQGYLNGQPLRIPGERFSPWWVEQEATEAHIGEGALRLSDVRIEARYTPPEEAGVAVPAEFRGRYANLIGFPQPPDPINLTSRRGALLYESLMDSEESVAGWVKEGPVNLRFEHGKMLMRSTDFAGNIVFWCPQDFPESFVAEWEFEPLSQYGLAIVFFAARGEHGEDIFDPSLPARDGNFGHYIKGAITSYHVSYFANIEGFQMGRPDSNLRKNNKFYRVGGGPVAIEPGAQGWQHMRLIKDGNRIQLFANGKISVDWTDDDPERYGPPHGGGKIGLRQMTPTIGAYRNFRVWKLK